MKHLFLIASLSLLSVTLPAQAPANDDCTGVVNLGTAPACPSTVFSNRNATPSDIGNDNLPSCFAGDTARRDVWFQFTCPAGLLDLRVALDGVGPGAIVSPQLAVYRGDCQFDGLAELTCVSAAPGEKNLFVDLVGLTPGASYFLRVSDFSATAAPNWGDFTLCVDSIPPIITIDGGGSSLCAGTVYDTGGPDGDYGPNEEFVFVICPDNPAGCIEFTLDYFNIEYSPFGAADVLVLYDGPDVNSPILANIGGDAPNPVVTAGGSVCFQTRATSGCITLQFLSNNAVQAKGFKGSWRCSPVSCPNPPLPVVDNSISAADIVAAVSTPATVVNVADIRCPSGAYGTFAYADENNPLGLQKGILLTSGSTNLAFGPNTTIDNNGVENQAPGDRDLDTLSNQSGNFLQSFDACVIELDVFVATDELTFEYTFGSEEYPLYVETEFNDIFAFLVSGPGISGDPALNNAVNVAVLPGTNTPIEINSVNFLTNWAYFRNTENSPVIQYNGLTIDSLGKKKTLTARIPVMPCETYRLKLAVSDRGDYAYDSGVFVSEISGGTPGLEAVFASGVDYLIENCTGNLDSIVITLSEPKPEDTEFLMIVTGSATRNVDYTLGLPPVVVIPAGATRVSFPIIPLTDALTEGTETIVVSLARDFGCGAVTLETITVNLNDNVDVSINGNEDTLFVCTGATVQLQAEGAIGYFWQPAGAVSDPLAADPTIMPVQDVLIRVTGTVGACTNVDSVYIRVADPMLEVVALTDTAICLGDSVLLQALNNTGGQGLSWTPVGGLSDPQSETPVATPTQTTTYRATIAIPGCTVFDEVTIRVDTLFFPNVATDTTVCQNYPVQLAENIGSSTQYDWSPGLFLSDSTIAGPIAIPVLSTTYTLVATSANGNCADTASVNVTVIPADLDIQGPDTVGICLGTEVPLTAVVNPPGGQITWSPAFYVSPATGENVTAKPDESVTLFASYVANGCAVTDSVRIRVDSLPEQTIQLAPDKPLYCPGDTVILFSKTYEPSAFPDIRFNWLPGGQQETPPDLWNLVITATDTLIFSRAVQNGACIDTASVQVNVGNIPDLAVIATPPGVCPGETVQLNATVDPQQKLEWQDDPTLSCTDCPNPVATPAGTTQYTVSTPDADCPASASIVVEVFPLPALALPLDPVICIGRAIQINTISEPGVVYNWTSDPPGFVSTAATPVVTPDVTTTYFVDAQGPQCRTQAQVTVVVVAGDVNAGADQTICFGEITTLTATTNGPPGNVIWQPGSLFGNSVEVSPGLTTDFTATYQFGDGCAVRDTVRVNVLPPVSIGLIIAEPDTTVLCEGRELRLTATVNPPDASLIWTQNGEVLPGQTDTVVVVTPVGSEPEPTAYTYVATATDANGCSASSAPYTVDILRCLFVPNTFTPGNDDLNETFGVVSPGGRITVVSIQIYNRWGQKVFEGDAENDRWDGTADGKPAPTDVYVYVITVRFPDGNEEVLHGDVTLLR